MKQLIDNLPGSAGIIAPQSNTQIKARRQLWLQVHLYLGLFVGAVLVVISLSGSLIVFAAQLDAWLNADMMHVDAPNSAAQFRSVEEIIASAKTAIPPDGKFANRISFPQQPGDVFEIAYNIPPSLDNHQVFVNPYTAEVLGQRLWGTFDPCCSWHGPLMAVIYRFHDSFWLGANGSILTGTTALLMLVSLISGMVLWWPSRSRLRSALTVKRRAGTERFNYDLHKVSGIYAALVLCILLFTGAYLSLQVPFPAQVKGLVSFFSPLTEKPKLFESTPVVGQAPIDIGQAVTIANQLFPDGVITVVFLPVGDNGVFKVLKHKGNKIMFSSRQQTIVIDAYSAKVLYQTDQSKRTSGDIFNEWQLALHSGEAFGVTGQIIVLITGLAPLVLYVTGIIRWSQKRRVRKFKNM
ncbi:putative iron-regulated membrane protein [Methylobacter tundripaludum]|uniref:Putative iron-regulated membrane protein n=1 Tax=Methylobacter tundripaludum TaxID=173365 RepID=A0A2S6HKI9_9GAMM|nr:PepSY-associated TM helix domain-containing protein [Methylobacter tundripaludum]PPK77990.1 putative iron-regulated membrane protein [Methylobacter tundripaludum]